MKFTAVTKPLSDGLNLIVLNQNVSQYYQKSCVAQLSVTNHQLRVNVEASGLMSEIRLNGRSDSPEESATLLVDCLLFKQLVNTLDSSTITFEFVEGGVEIQSGTSKFTLPQLLDSSEFSLTRPSDPAQVERATKTKLATSNWRFVRDSQLYAISTAFIHPVYTYIWLSDKGDVLVGDVDNGIFTHSTKSDLQVTCLIKDTIVNLLESMPDNAELVRFDGPADSHFVITCKTDSYELLSEFVPMYESNPDVGSYNSDMIFQYLNDLNMSCVVPIPPVNKILAQSELFSKDSENTVKFVLSGNSLTISDSNVSATIPVTGDLRSELVLEFKTKLFKTAFSHFDAESIQLSPIYRDDDAVGVVLQSDNLSTIISAV